MAVNTGPDINTYEIPEVLLSNTFNTWKDVTNLSTYKLNKLEIYSGLSSASIDTAVSSAGVLSAALAPTITSGHTFEGGIKGTTAQFNAFNGVGSNLIIGNNVTGISIGHDGINSTTRILSPDVYINGNLYVGGTATYINTQNLSIADTVIVLGASGGVGVTGAAQELKDRGIAFYYGETAGTVTATMGFFGFDRSSSNFVFYSGGGSTSANEVYRGNTGTFQGHFLGGGATFDTLTGTTASFLGQVKFAGGATFSKGVTLEVGATLSIRSGLQFMRGNTSVGFIAPSVVNTDIIWTLPGVTGAPGKVLGVDPSSANGTSLAWIDGGSGGGGGGGIGEPAGSDKQVQYNSSNTLSASSQFVFHNDATIGNNGISAGTLGLSGGLWALGNVGVGMLPSSITGQIIPGKSKLQVQGDVRLHGGGFFVAAGMTVGNGSATTNSVIVANDNALFLGRLNIAVGSSITVEVGATLIIL